MSEENFLSFLQQLLTMVELEDADSIALTETALTSVTQLANLSGKTDAFTLFLMVNAVRKFDYLLENKDYFAGVPGEIFTNRNKRKLLKEIVGTGL